MPTGYTAAIEKGISLRQFILNCTRAMGACIMQREDDAGDPPKKREPTDYHVKEIERVEAVLREVELMDDATAQIRATEEYDKELQSIEEGIIKNNTLRQKYETMLSQVKSWIPPTPDHQGLKDFMISQITESISFDCSDYHTNRLDKLKLLSPQEWKHKEMKRALTDLNYHQKGNSDELGRCRSQNNWIDKLYASLPE